MKLSPEDKYINHIVLLNNMDDDSKARLQADANEHLGDPWQLTLSEFFSLSEGDLSHIGLTKETSLNASIRQYIWMQEFSDVVQSVVATLKRLQVPQSDEAKQAAQFCLKTETNEAAIVFARRYFGLKTFAEAWNVTISDFIIAKKDEFNTLMFQHAMNEIQRAKFKKK